MVMESVSTEVPFGHTPVLLFDGTVTCQTPSGSITSFVLKTHDCVTKVGHAASCLVFVEFFLLGKKCSILPLV